MRVVEILFNDKRENILKRLSLTRYMDVNHCQYSSIKILNSNCCVVLKTKRILKFRKKVTKRGKARDHAR